MKNKIKRLSKGDFHIPQPDIIFSETHITMRVGEGVKYIKAVFLCRIRERGLYGGWCILLLSVCAAKRQALTAIR